MAMKYFGPFHNYIRPLTGAILGDFLGQNRERLAQFIVGAMKEVERVMVGSMYSALWDI